VKKTTQRTLTLNRETLRSLEDNRLKRVAGGYYSTPERQGITACRCPLPLYPSNEVGVCY
jgi:hypothetical protein